MNGTENPDHRSRHTRGLLRIVLAAGLIVAFATIPNGGAAAQQPPAPTFRHVSQFPVSAAPAQYELVQLVLDFAPGAFTRLHNHGGPAYVTVMEGQITRLEDGKESVYGPGQTFTEAQGKAHSAGNKGSAKARLMASILLSPGQPLTLNQPEESPPATVPATAVLSRTTLGTQPAEFTLTQVVVDFGSGAYLPMHTHGGPGLATVIDGEIAFSTSRPGEVRLRPGGTFLDVGDAHDARNVASGSSTAIATLLIRRGAGTTTFVTPPQAPAASPSPAGITPPRTGDGGLAGD